jgi:hypothetical protein
MDAINYEKIILNGINGLPSESLREVADFVYFLRKKTENPEAFAEEHYQDLIIEDLGSLDENELKHLESEFENYEQLYPRK